MTLFEEIWVIIDTQATATAQASVTPAPRPNRMDGRDCVTGSTSIDNEQWLRSQEYGQNFRFDVGNIYGNGGRRPTYNGRSMEGHHILNQRWWQSNVLPIEFRTIYNGDRAPAILMPGPMHDETRRRYNQWAQSFPNQSVPWDTLSWEQVLELTEQQLDAANISGPCRENAMNALSQYIQQLICEGIAYSVEEMLTQDLVIQQMWLYAAAILNNNIPISIEETISRRLCDPWVSR